ncbi:MAG TPA: tetratricopeptide repeat protein [Ferruginibacter sp.]|nr:tetratricopeptide repeat protein [Ferruginibacter sp.]
MSIKKGLFLLFIFVGMAAHAQNIRSQATFRMLKTATSLMEAQQFDAAEEYFKKGLEKSRASNDLYCQAFAQEGLGNLYTKTDQPEKAIVAYRVAIKLYRSQGLSVIANIVESLLKSVQGIGELYAGVEIGAKGIKLSVIEVKLSKDREYDYSLKADTAINTDAASLSYQSEKETEDAISLLLDIIKFRYQVPAKRTYIVISSGLKQELDKYNKVDYFANVIRPKNMDSLIRITYVTAAQESELSFLGIVPQKYRFNTDQLDVGGGNTKGGYFNANKQFVPVTFPLGTKSFQRLIESRQLGAQGDLNEYLKTAEQIMKDSLGRLMVYEFANKREFKSRDIVYLSGGIVWAIASLMHPQSISNNYIEITSHDIAEFRKLIYSNFEDVTQPDVTLISNTEDAKASLRNINRVLKTYDQRAMLAGAIWLDELIQQVNTINPTKKFVYPKYAYVGWISGYIIKNVTRQYTGLVN